MRTATALGAIVLASCTATPPKEPVRPAEWALAMRPAAGLDLRCGHAVVAGDGLVLTRLPSRPKPESSGPVVVEVPEEAGVGEPFWIEVRRPRGGASRKYRLVPLRPGLRLPDGDVVVLEGPDAVRVRAVADSAGPAAFEAREFFEGDPPEECK